VQVREAEDAHHRKQRAKPEIIGVELVFAGKGVRRDEGAPAVIAAIERFDRCQKRVAGSRIEPVCKLRKPNLGGKRARFVDKLLPACEFQNGDGSPIPMPVALGQGDTDNRAGCLCRKELMFDPRKVGRQVVQHLADGIAPVLCKGFGKQMQRRAVLQHRKRKRLVRETVDEEVIAFGFGVPLQKARRLGRGEFHDHAAGHDAEEAVPQWAGELFKDPVDR